MTLKDKLFSFNGRLRRRDFWFLNIGIGVVMIALILALSLALGADIGNDDDVRFNLAYFLAALIVIWPSLAVSIKRCHDRNQSGWWYLIILIPLIGSFWAFINLGCLDGTPGRNKYGVSPKFGAEDEAAVFA